MIPMNRFENILGRMRHSLFDCLLLSGVVWEDLIENILLQLLILGAALRRTMCLRARKS